MKKGLIVLILMAVTAILAVVEYYTIGFLLFNSTFCKVSALLLLTAVCFTTIAHYGVFRNIKKALFCFLCGVFVTVFAVVAANMIGFLPMIIDSIPYDDSASLLLATLLGMLYLPIVYGSSLYLYLHFLSGLNLRDFVKD